MNVTIFSDASICPNTMAGGWAGWIKCDRGTLAVGGELKSPLIDTTIAEAMAAMNAISVAIAKGLVHEGDMIVLATDNDKVTDILEGRARRKFRKKDARKRKWSYSQLRIYVQESNRHIDRISAAFEKRMALSGVDFRWNHVKGHRGRDDRRSAVNHGCDKRAKASMKKARRRIVTAPSRQP